VLLQSAGQPAAAVPLEVSDDPCLVLLSSAGLLARTADTDPPGDDGGRTNHDVVVSVVRATARGQVGVLTSSGRLVRLDVLDLPTLPRTANAPQLQGGAPLGTFLALDGGERALALCTLREDGPGLALGTRQGVVKRVNPELLARDAWEVVRLTDGDEVVGAVELTTGDEELCFVSSDAQLLHFPAAAVRPQGRTGGGMAGIRLAPGAQAVFFGVVPPTTAPGSEPVVVTVSGASSALPGTEPGSVKVTWWAQYPGKGRATGGVRCHRFLRGEDTLVLAWVGPGPARAAAASGAPVDLPPPDDRRDGSGTPAPQPVAAVAAPAAAQLPEATEVGA
jgi:DNA gyrase subunit A